MHVSQITVYPVKSCRGIPVPAWPLDDLGLAHDRQFMVVDADGRCLSQRENPRMATVGTRLDGTWLTIDTAAGSVRLPLRPPEGQGVEVRLWEYRGMALDTGPAAAELLTAFLGTNCRLVALPLDHDRPAAMSSSDADVPIAFSDGAPLLIAGQSSLDDLNSRLAVPVPMDRFRPNLVIAGAAPFAEDGWGRIRVGQVEIDLAGPCPRCAITTIDQQAGVRAGPEPLRSLAEYRRGAIGLEFGQNAVHLQAGTLRVGDTVEVLSAR